MREFNYIITDPEGIHARPAGLLVKEAGKYESIITLEVNGKKADAKRIFGVMGLGAKKDMELRVIIEGSDEDTAAEAIEGFLKENL